MVVNRTSSHVKKCVFSFYSIYDRVALLFEYNNLYVDGQYLGAESRFFMHLEATSKLDVTSYWDTYLYPDSVLHLPLGF